MLPEKFSFPDKHLSATNRFKFGDRSPKLSQMFDSRPVFAFDFLCCSDHEFSLFHPNVTVFDFHTTLTRFHELSRITLRVLSENSENLRFHDVTAKVQCHSILLDDLARVFKIN